MSEKIYAWLLRLYPSRFREAYGEEALELFRDRCRDEPGFLLGLRLWLDLLGDLALSLPRAYLHVQPALTSCPAHVRSEGGPSFLVLEDESLGPGALFFGSVLGLAAVVSFSLLLNHGVKHVPLSALIRPARSSANHRSSSLSPRPPEPARDFPEGAVAPTAGRQPEMAASSCGPEDGKAKAAESNGPAPDGPRAVKDAGRQLLHSANGVVAGAKLHRAERQRVIREAAVQLEKHYIDPVVAQKVADALLKHEKDGDDDAATDGRAFAEQLTRQMRDVSHDRHLGMFYSEAPWPRQLPAPTPPFGAHYREAMEQRNCTFEPVKILPHDIGYLKLDSFPDPSLCRQTAAAAMASLNDADAIVVDLRDNRGGEPAMVSLMAAYLFDHPEYLYNPRENVTEESWTHSPVPGNKLADKPVYVLTSGRTFSGAEQFCYDLKMLKRVTLVGETTGGGAHSGVWHRIDDHFGMGIPETKPINPYSKTDWAEVGVEPDIKVKAADALETAVKLAERKLHKQ